MVSFGDIAQVYTQRISLLIGVNLLKSMIGGFWFVKS